MGRLVAPDGRIQIGIIARVIQNYDMVYGLQLPMEVVADTLDGCDSQGDGSVLAREFSERLLGSLSLGLGLEGGWGRDQISKLLADQQALGRSKYE